MTLHVPDVTPDDDTLGAALKYAAAGWYVLPVRRRARKHPGSVVGKDWQHQSSRDPQQIAAWYAGTDHGIALHVGRSGALVADVDYPDRLPEVLDKVIADAAPPYQTTRDGDPRRGHYVFAQPPGRMLGNGTGKLGGAWGEVRGLNGVIIVAPSPHDEADQGGRYRWEQTGAVPVLPECVAELLHDATPGEDAATDEQVQAFREAHTGTERVELLDVWCALYARKVADGESRHDRMLSVLAGACKEARAGYFPATAAVDRLEAAFLAAVAAPPQPGSKQRNARAGSTAAGEWLGILAWAVGQADAADLDEVRARATDKVPSLSAWLEDRPPEQIGSSPAADRSPLAALLIHLHNWHDIGDYSHVTFALAVAVSSVDGGEALWGMLVGPPSSLKTETVRVLDDITDARVDELTAPALMSWSKHKDPKPVGILIRIPPRAMLTVGDFSTVLATSDRGGRDQLFALLRRVYDGAVTRDLGNAPGPLRWTGRLTILAAVTPTIDQYGAHSDALGPRWLYLRLPEVDTARRRRGAARRIGDLEQLRAEGRKLAREAVMAARAVLPDVDLDDRTLTALADAAVVATAARGDVPRDGYGRRQIIGMAVVEEPHRLAAQLRLLVRSCIALGVTTERAVDLAHRAALDTVPRSRMAVLGVLCGGESLAVAQVAERAGMHRNVARAALEDLRELRITECPIEDSSDVEDVADLGTIRRDWHLTVDLGDLAREVLLTPQLDTKSGDHPPDPPDQRDKTGTTKRATEYHPTLRVKPKRRCRDRPRARTLLRPPDADRRHDPRGRVAVPVHPLPRLRRAAALDPDDRGGPT